MRGFNFRYRLCLTTHVLLMSVVGCNSDGGPVALTVQPTAQSAVDSRNSIREANRALVRDALEHLEDGQVIEVDEMADSQCGGTEANFTLQKKGRRLDIQLSEYVKFADSPDPELFKQLEDCLPEIKKVWDRYDIDLNVDFTDAAHLNNKKIQKIVTLHRGPERSNDENFYSGDPQYCMMVLHELGHHMGLPDEYVEAGTCRKPELEAKERNPDSVMRDPRLGWEAMEFLPRHLKTILGGVFDPPLARNQATIITKRELSLQLIHSTAMIALPAGTQASAYDVELPNHSCVVAFERYFPGVGEEGDFVIPAGSKFLAVPAHLRKYRDREGKLRYNHFFDFKGQFEGEKKPGENPIVLKSIRCGITPSELQLPADILAPDFEIEVMKD